MEIIWILPWLTIVIPAISGLAFHPLIDYSAEIIMSSPDRRNFILSAVPTVLVSPGIIPFPRIKSGEVATYRWNEDDSVPMNWSQLRYSTSTLAGSSSSSSTPTQSNTCAIYPQWMKGYWLTEYKFKKASFPQGRNVLSLRVPGAGLATCLSLPNVGYNPPIFCQNYLSSAEDNKNDNVNNNSFFVYEDVAYNLPRKLEAFWPQCKVTAIQTTTSSNKLSPKCFLTGEQCTTEENPSLHAPTTRFVLDFEGPTRSGGGRRLLQSIDTTLLHTKTVSEEVDDDNNSALVRLSNQYAQFNVQQDLQCFYKEVVTLQKRRGDLIEGSVRVAAFLPKTGGTTETSYDDSEALALYDYTIRLNRIDESEASQV